MIRTETPEPQKMVVTAAPTPRMGTGVAYLVLAGLFLYLGVTEGRWTSTALGLLNLVFAYFTLKPRSRTTVTLDKSQGTMTLVKQTFTSSGEVTHALSELQAVQVNSVKLMWRTLHYTAFVLADGRQLALQHSIDKDLAHQEAAAQKIREFLGLRA